MEKQKSKSVKAVPEGFHTVTPYLIVDDAIQLVEFIKHAFDGRVTYIMKDKSDKIVHATVTVGNSFIMISDTMEGSAPQTAMLYLYLEDADGTYRKALNSGAEVLHEPTTEFYGDRAAAVKDKWGNVWWVATHVEDVDDAELERRAVKAQEERSRKKEPVHH